VNPEETISKMNCLPDFFLKAADFHFPETTLHGVMLEITETCRLLSTEELRVRWLSEEELQKHSSFKLKKRRDEWLSGRICAKLAAGQMQGFSKQQEYSRITVVNVPGGRPALKYQGVETPHNLDVSLSHSGNLAVALVATDYCGIDIQETTETLLRVKERFCSADDEHNMKSYFDVSAGATELNLLWTAKEAIRKTLSHLKVPDFLALKLTGIDLISKNLYILHFLFHDQKISTICGPYMNYSLALCVQKG
jgi:phosphopantetheinyl transferase